MEDREIRRYTVHQQTGRSPSGHHSPAGHLPERPAPRETPPQAAETNSTRSGLGMSQTLYRVTPADLEIRADGRTVSGIAVPFDEPARVRDGNGTPYTEVMRRGAFAKTIRERASSIKLLVNHDAMLRLPIGAATLLREDAAGLYAEFRVSATRDGDEALTLIQDGVLDGLSVGFSPVKGGDRRSRDMLERLEVKLREVSAVAFPAYAGARVIGVRSDLKSIPLSRAQALLRISELESM